MGKSTGGNTDTAGHSNANLSAAKSARKDEFYTQWADIEKEMNAYLEYDPDVFRGKTILLPCDDPEWSNFTKYFALHFTEYGIHKLISTSYAPDSNQKSAFYTPTLFETDNPIYDRNMSKINGRMFTLEPADINGDGVVNIEDIQWKYLAGDGDFRSDEITALRDQADIIITNPPFSLFREFMAWLIDGGMQFSVIGNVNTVTNKDVFPLIQQNKVWLGPTISSGDREFRVPDNYPLNAAGSRTDADGNRYIRIKGVRWFTNIEHGHRHEPLQLMTMADNLRFSKHKSVRELGYRKYDNYDAIEVGYTSDIPSDYDGIMGVPITFLDKHNPDQFDILGLDQRGCHDAVPDTKKYDDYREMRPDGTATGSSGGKTNENANLEGNSGKGNYFINGQGHVVQSCYKRLFIRRKADL